MRYLKALMSGCYIVSEEWVEATVREVEGGAIVHELTFLVAGDREGLLDGGGGGAISSLTASTLIGNCPFDSSMLREDAGSSLYKHVPESSAQARARAAVESADPTRLLFSGVTFVLWGEFECPPKQLSLYDAVELITLGGGRSLEFELESLQADSTPSISALKAAAAAATAAASGVEKEKEAASDKSKSLSLPRSSGLWTRLMPDSSSSSSSSSLSTRGWTSADKEWHQLLMTLASTSTARRAIIQDGPTSSSSSLSSSSSSTSSSPPPSLPPFIIICDEPKLTARLPQKVKAILEGLPKFAMMATPEWLLDCCASYSLIRQ